MSVKKVSKYTNKFSKNLIGLGKMASRRISPLYVNAKDKEAHRIGGWRFGNLKRERIEKVFPNLNNISIKLENIFDRELDMSIDIGELAILNALVKYIDADKIIEIGTFDGNTTLNLAANIKKNGAVYTVDLPKERFQDIPIIYDNSIKSELIGLQYKNSKYKDKIRQIYSDSTKLDWSKIDTPVDIFFIDGCHYYDIVKKDTDNALKYTRKGGLIIWHDYGMIDDVSRVVDETAKKIKVRAVRGTRLAIGFN